MPINLCFRSGNSHTVIQWNNGHRRRIDSFYTNNPTTFQRGPKNLLIFGSLSLILFLASGSSNSCHTRSSHSFTYKHCSHNYQHNRCFTHHRHHHHDNHSEFPIILIAAMVFLLLFVIQILVNIKGRRYSRAKMETGYYENIENGVCGNLIDSEDVFSGNNGSNNNIRRIEMSGVATRSRLSSAIESPEEYEEEEYPVFVAHASGNELSTGYITDESEYQISDHDGFDYHIVERNNSDISLLSPSNSLLATPSASSSNSASNTPFLSATQVFPPNDSLDDSDHHPLFNLATSYNNAHDPLLTPLTPTLSDTSLNIPSSSDSDTSLLTPNILTDVDTANESTTDYESDEFTHSDIEYL